jgi:hypothetical protein
LIIRELYHAKSRQPFGLIRTPHFLSSREQGILIPLSGEDSACDSFPTGPQFPMT